ncbi:MAG: FtsX-like permease family protein [Burkholderiales bacterium]|nr:FtsX-like permease family protein [Burkholderiales bacterium]
MLSSAGVRASLALAPLAANKGRVAVSVFAIALGVALGYAVQLINQSAAAEFAQALRVLAGDADVVVHGPRAGIPEALYPRIAALPEVAVASPVIEVQARLPGQREALKLLGVDVFRAARLQPDIARAEGGEPLDFLREDRLFLSRAAAAWLGLTAGDELALAAGEGRLALRVAGILSASALRERVAVMDIAAVQSALRTGPVVTRIELRLREGADPAALSAALERVLPPGVFAEDPGQSVERNARLTRAYRVNLAVLALVALFTGALFVFSTQMLSVARRRVEIALLRALGVARGGILRQLLAEAALIGALGAAGGMALGHLAAAAFLQRYGADLGAGTFAGLPVTPHVDPVAVLVFALLGVAAAVGGAYAAARTAVRAQPARALRAGDEHEALRSLEAAWPGAACLAAGALLAFVPAIDGLPIAGYLSITLLLIGTLALMPRLARVAFALAPQRRAASWRLALEQLRFAPGRTGMSLAAIVASVSLMASMAIMVASFRHSLQDWLDTMLPAQLYVRGGEGAFLADEALRSQWTVPGVARIEFLRSEQILLDVAHPPVTLLARDLDAARIDRSLALVGESRLPAPGAPPPAWVSEAMVDLYGMRAGDVVALALRGRVAAFTVAGVWRDYARQHGAVVIERREYARLTGEERAGNASIWLEPGADPDAVAAQVRSRMPAHAEVELVRTERIRELTLGIFDRTFAVTYALEAVAVLIGLFSLSASFAGLALARRCEFGMLRHVGMTRRQIGAMLALEGFAVSALGLAAGLGLGGVLAVVLVHVVNRQSFHWSMEIHTPWPTLAAFALVMLPLASFAAWAGARRAAGYDAVRAVKESW